MAKVITLSERKKSLVDIHERIIDCNDGYFMKIFAAVLSNISGCATIKMSDIEEVEKKNKKIKFTLKSKSEKEDPKFIKVEVIE